MCSSDLAYFSQHVLNPEWVSGLLGSWIETLKKLPAYRAALPEDIQNRIREISYCEKEDIESIHPPDKSHEPMLYQYLSTDKSTYTQQIEFYFKGHVDDFLLIKAWTEVISRHESLRSLFPMPFAGEFYRVALRKARTSTEYFDLSHLPEPLALTQKNELLEAERKRGFDLNKGPLLRTQIYRFDSNGFMLSWCFHHLLMDGWCMGILLRELFVLYETLDGGSSERLPDPIPLSDYVRWRSSYDELSARQYWDSLLDGFKPLKIGRAHV